MISRFVHGSHRGEVKLRGNCVVVITSLGLFQSTLYVPMYVTMLGAVVWFCPVHIICTAVNDLLAGCRSDPAMMLDAAAAVVQHLQDK